MATGAVIGGAVLSGGSQIYGGIQARKAAKEQQAALDARARLERESAEFEAIQAGRKFDKLLGTQKARISGSGIMLEGSPMMLIEETLRDKAETIANIKRHGQARSDALKAQAGNVRDAGRDALTSSIIGAFGTGLKTASKFGGSK
jgi:hypothetical protein